MSKRRVLRGGSYVIDSRYLHTSRVRGGSEDRFWLRGFRIVVRRRKQ